MLSIYSVYVEIRAEEDESYEALCDINSRISCTRVFTSKFAKGFGIMPEALNLPNGVYGMFFYSSMALLSKFC
jgi:vitamin-K-epoxide reductase (warfarin-sensitive)